MKPRTPQRALGDRGEALAVAHLARAGYRVLARNVRCRRGELDCVALDGDTICFVEVKTAAAGSGVDPEEHLTPSKTRALRQAAREYLQANRLDEDSVDTRFDVVAVRMAGDRATITLYKEAF